MGSLDNALNIFLHPIISVFSVIICTIICILLHLIIHRKSVKSPKFCVEICLGDIQSVSCATLGGANSIELCCNLPEGGITPSYALIKSSALLLKSKYSYCSLHVLIRPRPGNFVYSEEEFQIILEDIRIARKIGADGVVTGILMPNNCVDIERMKVVRGTAKGMKLTFHRAFDLVSDPLEAFESIIALKCDRLLTSGSASSAINGMKLIQQLTKLNNNRIEIIAAAGINESNVGSMVANSNIQGIHVGSAVLIRQGAVDIFSISSSSTSPRVSSAEIIKNEKQSPPILLPPASASVSRSTVRMGSRFQNSLGGAKEEDSNNTTTNTIATISVDDSNDWHRVSTEKVQALCKAVNQMLSTIVT